MDQAFIDQAEGYPTLGPHYFAARKVAEEFMAKFEPEHFEPLIRKAADAFYTQMQESLEASLLSDVESNIHGTMWRQIDDSVKALLSGERWALERYALGTRYECDKIRAAIASHIPAELQEALVKDLEDENKRLREDNEMLRRYR